MKGPGPRGSALPLTHQGARGDAVGPLEEAGEVSLVGEARALGDVRKVGTAQLEQPPCALEPQPQQVLMGRPAHRLLERARKVRRRQADLAGQHQGDDGPTSRASISTVNRASKRASIISSTRRLATPESPPRTRNGRARSTPACLTSR